ncbi:MULTISPECIES: GFA family protein [Streptomyces]|uniref:GFA family protein n=1 Tax=Streptomyces TaxID=1883 RepID=UPI0009A23179|nr:MULTISPECIES: GFA family protein [unclassified Streptomyces]QNQ38238.1 GFA family protein [Streptomyces sp. CB00271]
MNHPPAGSQPAATPLAGVVLPNAGRTGVEPDRAAERRTGRCQCGRIAYEVLGHPDDPHLCSCTHCVRISGSPAVLWVGFPRSTLTWTNPEGLPSWYPTWPTLHRGFCPGCGTHLISVADDSDLIMVTAFSLDDRGGTDPVGHSYRHESVPWMTTTLADAPSAPQLTSGSAV